MKSLTKKLSSIAIVGTMLTGMTALATPANATSAIQVNGNNVSKEELNALSNNEFRSLFGLSPKYLREASQENILRYNLSAAKIVETFEPVNERNLSFCRADAKQYRTYSWVRNAECISSYDSAGSWISLYVYY